MTRLIYERYKEVFFFFFFLKLVVGKGAVRDREWTKEEKDARTLEKGGREA